MHRPGEAGQLAGQELVAHLEGVFGHPREVVELLLGGNHLLLLIGQYAPRVALLTGVEQQQVSLQRGDGLLGQRQRCDHDAAVGQELHEVQPAVSRRVLVLPADGLT